MNCKKMLESTGFTSVVAIWLILESIVKYRKIILFNIEMGYEWGTILVQNGVRKNL